MATKHLRSKTNFVGQSGGNLVGHLMVALPGFKAEEFQETVILVCHHDQTGAMGLVINQPISGVHLSDLIEESNFLRPDHEDLGFDAQPVFWGGPVHVNQGFVLHSSEVSWATTLSINSEVSVTALLDIIEEDVVEGDVKKIRNFPIQYRAMLGHVSWKPGQIEKEWLHQSWVSVPYQSNFLLDMDPEKQWMFMLDQCGVRPMSFSPIQGRI